MPKKKPISIGLHPWYAKRELLDMQIKYLNVLARQPNVQMIGECGLDKLRGESMKDQLEIFEAQIRLAEELNKPLIIHCVKAFDELLSIKKRLQPKVPMIIHGFQKNTELAYQLIRKGFYLSFGATVITSEELKHLIKDLHHPFFLETDDGAAGIEQVYAIVAEIRKIDVEELKDCIFANWKAIGLMQ
ncbi:Tat-linked quality control protein TatD [compost metagenome]